jgi:hypothetical protein
VDDLDSMALPDRRGSGHRERDGVVGVGRSWRVDKDGGARPHGLRQDTPDLLERSPVGGVSLTERHTARVDPKRPALTKALRGVDTRAEVIVRDACETASSGERGVKVDERSIGGATLRIERMPATSIAGEELSSEISGEGRGAVRVERESADEILHSLKRVEHQSS